MARMKDLTGQRFGRDGKIRVLRVTVQRKHRGQVLWLCSDGKLRTGQALQRLGNGEDSETVSLRKLRMTRELLRKLEVEGGLDEYIPVAGGWWDPDESGGGA